LRLQLKAAHPLKTDGAVTEMLTQRAGPGGIVEESEWRKILEYMYAPGDAAALAERVRDGLLRAAVAADVGAPPPPSALALTARAVAGDDAELEAAQHAAAAAEARLTAAVGALTPNECEALLRQANPRLRVSWADFLKTLLDFQLAGHEKFLAKFRRIFRAFDTAKTGVISAASFQQLVAAVMPGAQPVDVVRLQRLVDPFGTDKVTFSACVAALSRELAPQQHQHNHQHHHHHHEEAEAIEAYPPPPPPTAAPPATSAAAVPSRQAVPPPTVTFGPPSTKVVISSSMRPGGGKVVMSSGQ
jgi:hypothetical protein